MTTKELRAHLLEMMQNRRLFREGFVNSLASFNDECEKLDKQCLDLLSTIEQHLATPQQPERKRKRREEGEKEEPAVEKRRRREEPEELVEVESVRKGKHYKGLIPKDKIENERIYEETGRVIDYVDDLEQQEGSEESGPPDPASEDGDYKEEGSSLARSQVVRRKAKPTEEREGKEEQAPQTAKDLMGRPARQGFNWSRYVTS